MEHCDKNYFAYWASNFIINDNLFDDDGNIIMKNKFDYKTTGKLAEILEDHWEDFYSKYKDELLLIRPNCNMEVNKLINCHNHDLGATVYYCEHDDEVYFCHHTCKGRLCSSCGIKTQKLRVQSILEKCINTSHRHITFTIPNTLVSWFIDKLTATNLLFDAACETLYSVVNGKVPNTKTNKYKQKYMPGFFAFLHTFGRPLNFNPHIHVVFCEGVIDRNKKFKKLTYLNYDALSKRFMKLLLDKMEKYFGKDVFYETKRNMYAKYPNGFYVNNKMEDEGIKFHDYRELISYLTRYCSRPAIAESRILKYDGETVTYSYTDHKDNKYQEITVTVEQFIKKILIHLLPKNFKSIRYYGFYNKNDKIDDDLFNKLIKPEKREFFRSLNKWCNLIVTSFKRIPIICPKCNNLMKPIFEVS